MKKYSMLVFITLLLFALLGTVKMLETVQNQGVGEFNIVTDKEIDGLNPMENIELRFDFNVRKTHEAYISYINGQVVDEGVNIKEKNLFDEIGIKHNYGILLDHNKVVFYDNNAIYFYKRQNTSTYTIEKYKYDYFKREEGHIYFNVPDIEFELINETMLYLSECEDDYPKDHFVGYIKSNMCIVRGNKVYTIPIEAIDNNLGVRCDPICYIPNKINDIIDVEFYEDWIQLVGIGCETDGNYSIYVYIIDHLTGEVIAENTYKNIWKPEVTVDSETNSEPPTSVEYEHCTSKTDVNNFKTIINIEWSRDHQDLLYIVPKFNKENGKVKSAAVDIKVINLDETIHKYNEYLGGIIEFEYINDMLYICYIGTSHRWVGSEKFAEIWDKCFVDLDDWGINPREFRDISIIAIKDEKIIYKGHVEADIAKGMLEYKQDVIEFDALNTNYYTDAVLKDMEFIIKE